MEDLAEGVFRGILRFIKSVIIEGICEGVCYWVGRLFLQVVTMGNYPRGKQTINHQGRITVVGILVCIAIVATVSTYL